MDLRERLPFKRTVLRDPLHGALVARGTPEAEAAVAAELGRLAFSTVYRRWATGREPAEFAELADEEVAALLRAASRLEGRPASEDGSITAASTDHPRRG